MQMNTAEAGGLNLEKVKRFIRVEHDEDDELLEGLMKTAGEYIEGVTGKRAEGSQAYKLAVLQLTAHWYENRIPVVSGTVADVPLTVDLLVKHIALCGEYPEAVHETDQ